MEPYQLFARIFIEADADQAARDAEVLTGRFQLPASGLRIEPYPKFEGWQLLSFRLILTHPDPNQSLAEASQALGSGWELSFGDSPEDLSGSAIWNPGPDHRFAVASARFAELGLFRPDETEYTFLPDLSAEDEALATASLTIDDEDF